METLVLFEWDAPKDDKRWQEYGKQSQVSVPYFEKKKEEGIIKEYGFWTDNTGHVVFLILFENEGNFAKIWGDEEFQKIGSVVNRLFDNAGMRLMRPVTVS